MPKASAGSKQARLLQHNRAAGYPGPSPRPRLCAAVQPSMGRRWARQSACPAADWPPCTGSTPCACRTRRWLDQAVGAFHRLDGDHSAILARERLTDQQLVGPFEQRPGEIDVRLDHRRRLGGRVITPRFARLSGTKGLHRSSECPRIVFVSPLPREAGHCVYHGARGETRRGHSGANRAHSGTGESRVHLAGPRAADHDRFAAAMAFEHANPLIEPQQADDLDPVADGAHLLDPCLAAQGGEMTARPVAPMPRAVSRGKFPCPAIRPRGACGELFSELFCCARFIDAIVCATRNLATLPDSSENMLHVAAGESL